ncbi:MAG: HEAT repeat domain-containing protein [Prolixibacteraceae bacterium]|nr:HEAT repeat domain-containing protein [Prolixibacteraceae bacterium]
MECKEYREQFTSLLTDSIPQAQRSEIESHLEGCANCREEFESAQKIWYLMGEMTQPEPSATMQSDFNAILSEFKKEQKVRKNLLDEWINKLREFLYLQVQPRLAYSLLLVAFGLVAGYFLHQPGQSAIAYNKQIDSLTSQVSEMKQVMMFSLLQDPSASQRMRAVAYTEEIDNVDLKVIGALFTTLNEDPNVNVRLATLDALVKLADEPKVREGLVRSIDLQDSPLMQTAIADVMVRLQEKSSVRSLQKLLHKKDLNEMVKFNIEKSIQRLI